MQSFVDFDRSFAGQPPRLGAQLARIDVGMGREQLYRDQLPELLRSLSEETRVASITASNAIENITVEPERAERLAVPDAEPRFRNRNEREFAGYRDAIDEIIRTDAKEPISLPFILHLHRQLFRHVAGGGGHLKGEANFIASYESGHREIWFAPPPPDRTEFMLRELIDRYAAASKQQMAHPVVLVAAFVLDFLAIHPVADGNGRLARLLTTHLLLQHGYLVARYVSVEQRIFESKNTYYDVLRRSQQGWHDGAHSIWPWVAYLVSVLEDAYEDFERRVAGRRGLTALSKRERVRAYVLEHAAPVFRIREIRRALPGVSDETIRLVLAQLARERVIEIDPDAGGRGPQAAWRRVPAA